MTRPIDDDLCGFSYDHDPKLIDERDGEAVYECRSCGAEVATDAADSIGGRAARVADGEE